MRLDEAKVILEENGYELLDEGKLGRAIGMAALALGTLFSNSNASNFDNLRDADSTEIQHEYQSVQNQNWDKVTITDNGIRARKVFKGGTVFNLFKPIKNIDNLNDDITAIIIGSNLSGYDEILTIVTEDGYVTHFTPEQTVVKDKNKKILTEYEINYKFFKEMVEHYREFISPI